MKFPKFADVATEITPELAQELLGSTTIQNRHVNQAKVDRYADLMRRREWSENGESIILDHKDNLMDGQHRLLALIQAGVTLRFVIVRGVAPTVMPTIDVGTARTAANVLHMGGYKNYSTLSAALGWLYRYETSRMMTTAAISGYTPSIAQAMARSHPGMQDSAAFAVSLANVGRAMMRGAPLAFCHYVMADKNQKLAVEFLTSLMDGANIKRGSPLFMLRRALTRVAAGGTPLTPLEAVALTFKAWSATRSGTVPHRLVWYRFGRQAEDFPPLEAGETTRGPVKRVLASPKIRMTAAHYVAAALQSGSLALTELLSRGGAPPFKLSKAAIRNAVKALGCVVVSGHNTKGKQVIALPERPAVAAGK